MLCPGSNRKVKYIRDPLYSEFIEIDELTLKVISHPYFQRMRRIRQLGLAEYVYPGATHTRFSHMLGAYHLSGKFLKRFLEIGEKLDNEEIIAVKLSALLHDIGHTSLSHALEFTILPFRHEEIGIAIIEKKFSDILGKQLVEEILKIFNRKCEPFKYQLIEGQMDVDRLDYLRRDAYYCGVDYGLIDIERIIQSSKLYRTMRGREMVLTPKGIFAAEGYIIARYLMYWSVYYHKTNLGFQAMLFSLFKRVRDIILEGANPFMPEPLRRTINARDPYEAVEDILYLDDSLILYTISEWQKEKDKVISDLSRRIINRERFKAVEVKGDFLEEYQRIETECKKMGLDPRYYIIERTPKDVAYTPYDPTSEESIKVDMNGNLKELSSVLPTDTLKSLSREVMKRYLFYPGSPSTS